MLVGLVCLFVVTVDVEAKISEVVLADLDFEHFIDNGQDVMERPNGLEWDSSWRTEDSAGGGQDQGVFNGCDRDAAIVKSRRENTVVAADDAGGSRRLPIGVKNLADVIPFGQIHNHEGFSIG